MSRPHVFRGVAASGVEVVACVTIEYYSIDYKDRNFASDSIPAANQAASDPSGSPSIDLSAERTDFICNKANSKLCFE
jgi:hypothetical protein